jgi:hypothetical protein
MWGILNKPRFNDIYLFSVAAGYLPSLLMSNLVGIPLLLAHLSTSILTGIPLSPPPGASLEGVGRGRHHRV